ncbi:hypothetical protein N9B17_01340 [Rhodopirellula sp.]|nr:hypothetical protein [Rhodopirellula sp.]
MSHAIGFCCTLESGLNDRSERTIDEWLIVPRGEGSINSVGKPGVWKSSKYCGGIACEQVTEFQVWMSLLALSSFGN